MKHIMKLRAIFFDKIKSGEKIYEIRLNDEKRKAIDVGDVVVFLKEPEQKESITTEVKDLVYFKTFDEMLNSLPLKEIGFDGMTVEEVKNIYYSFYTKQNEQKFGVVAIKIEVIGK